MTTDWEATECWVCDDPHVVYTDIIGCGWCEVHLTTLYDRGLMIDGIDER